MDEYTSPLSDKDREELKKAFDKYDKKKVGSIRPEEVADVFRMAGQNPTNDDCNRMIQEADEPGTGMLMFEEMISIVEKYWKNYENYAQELKEACLAFDRKDLGVMEMEEMKQILLKYGEQLDQDDMELFEGAFANEGKVIVDEFIKQMSPYEAEAKKGKKGKGSAKKSASAKKK